MRNGTFSLLEAAAKFEAFLKNIKYADEATLSEIAMLVRDKVKERIGTYVYKWPELAASTAAKLTCWTEVTI